MSGLLTDVWRIVKPTSPRHTYTAAGPDDFRLYSNFSWYTKVMKGAGSRFAKYSQYNSMDMDVFVARALDTIAEEMTAVDVKTDLPFDIIYQNEVNKEVPEHIVVTIRAALRHWADKQHLDRRVYDIARLTIKYGDCFFRKISDFKAWEYIDPSNVIGLSLKENNDDVDFYQLRKGTVSSTSGTKAAFGEIELVQAAGIVHFSLSSGIGLTGPFGISVLEPTIKAYKHLTLLEDSVIIYRIVRAPERRVFNIDVGNMPPQRAKAYLEAIKNDLKQKKIPNEAGGQDKIDSVYNPMSMTEDFFFAQTADGRGNKVDTLPGGENLGEIGDLNYFQNKFLQGLRIPASYMRGSTDSGAMINDGKVGVAYVEERRFAGYVKRLQQTMSPIFDKQFKAYLKSAELNIDPNIFKLKLIDPQDFEIYQRAEVDDKLIGNYTNLKDDETISTRTKQRLYLGWSEDDIQANEIQLKQERGIPEGGIAPRLDETRMLYDPKWASTRPDIKVSDEYEDFTTESEEAIGKTKEEEPADDTAPPADDKEAAPKDEKASAKDTAKDEAAPTETAAAEEPADAKAEPEGKKEPAAELTAALQL